MSSQIPITPKFHLYAVLFIAVVGILGYANTLSVPFVFDDYENVRDNSRIHVQRLDWQGLSDAAFNSPSGRRPVANLTFALNYYLVGDHVRGFHLVNLVIHIVCGLLVYRIGMDIFRRSAPGADRVVSYSALAAALVFVSHPLQTQAVTYIVQRMTCLATMFYLAALVCYIRGRSAARPRRLAWWIAAVACGLLALGSKEIAATLPLAVLLYEAYFFRDLDRVWVKRTSAIALVLMAVLVGVAVTTPTINAALFGGYSHRDFTMGERLLTEPRVVLHYLSLVIWPLPSRLSITHQFMISRGMLDPPTTLLSILAILSMAIVAVLTARSRPILSFCILWVLLNLVIESSAIPLELAYEHRMYLPMAGIAWLAGWMLFKVTSIRAATCATAAVVLLLTVATHARNEVWRDEVTLWADVVAKYPSDARAHNNLGSALASQGRHAEAIKHHRRALELQPAFPNALNNLGIALASQGDVAGAIEQYRAAIAADPQYALARNNLGNALIAFGDLAGAVSEYNKALEYQPDYADAHYNLAAALASIGKLPDAVDQYREALRCNPRYAQAANNLGALLAAQGNLTEAVEQIRYALSLEPDYIDALANLGSVLSWQGKNDEAREQLQRALILALAQDDERTAAAIRERLESLPK